MNKDCSLSQKVLFDLLKISLWGAPPQLQYSSLTDEDWMEVYRLSGSQGVRNLAFGGISQLPENVQPNEKLSLGWAVNTVLAKDKYLRNLEITVQLNERCVSEGIEMLLLKGAALASCYPMPAYREYGDLDIYLFGKHSQGDSFLRKHGIPVKEAEKHTTFIFQGVPVENHRMFIDQIMSFGVFCRKRKKAFEYVEKILHEILAEEQKQYLGSYGIRIPSATFHFLFMIMHTGTHLGKELVLRHLCDWACFLVAHKGQYNEERIEQALEQLNFRKLSLVMTDMAIHYLGMPVEFAPSFYKEGSREQINATFLNSLFEHFPSSNEVEKNSLRCRWKRFYANQWAYDLFKKEYLPERFCRTITVWIKEKWKRIEHQ